MIIAVGAVAFAAFLMLLAFGDDARSGRDGRAHALSVSGNGFAGLVSMTRGMGFATSVARDKAALTTPGLLIVTPPAWGDGEALSALVARRQGRPTLIVLQKWETQPRRDNRSWREVVGTLPAPMVLAPLSTLAPRIRLGDSAVAPNGAAMRLTFARIGARPEQQRLAPAGLQPILLDAKGRLVLAKLPERAVYLLAEPDLFDNAGLADREIALAAMTVIDTLAPSNEIVFDVTLNGLATTHGALRLLLEPPFLPATLCLALAALLAGLHGAVRFGAPAPPTRAVAFGRAALLDNTALLVRAARKELELGPAYAALMLTEAAAAAGLPAAADRDALARQLDTPRTARGHPSYETLIRTASAVRNRQDLVAAARALHCWMRNVPE